MMIQEWEKILNLIKSMTVDNDFKLIESNGTRLFGHVKMIGENAWFHEVFAPLDVKEITEIELELKIQIPKSLKSFFQCSNGIILFSDELAIFGKRKSFKRTGDDVRLPYSIINPNTFERPSDAKNNYLFIGSYSYDGSKIFIDTQTEIINVCERWKSLNVVCQWNNIWDFLLQEMNRLQTFFNDNMMLKDNKRCTLPPNRFE